MDDCGDMSNDGYGDGHDTNDDSTKYESDDDMEASDSVSEGTWTVLHRVSGERASDGDDDERQPRSPPTDTSRTQ